MKKIRIIIIAAAVCLVLTGCIRSSPAKSWQEAIAAVDGVDEVTVQWTNHAGMGTSTRISIVAETNDEAELLETLDDTLRAFAHSLEPDDITSLSYMLYSSDRTTHLSTNDINPEIRSLEDLRRYYDIDT